MSVIIRLQNLPWSANALDIRQFFHGLSIPEGGVHIVGGEQGDAFIAFSTDEDARQAFSRNSGKIKEIQISLMLSSRTEMQKVIETARAQSYAAFMPTAATPLPAAVPAIVPALVPEVKKSSSKENDKSDGKRDRKRSRSRSRDRKDRDRRRHRDRSRSRSRDRRDRRRRDRSRSRGRSRSRDRDRKNNRDRKRSPDIIFPKDTKKVPEVWSNPNASEPVPTPPQAPTIIGNFGQTLDDARRNLGALNAGAVRSNFLGTNFGLNNRSRDSWPPQSVPVENGQNNFLNRSDLSIRAMQQSSIGPGFQNSNNRRFPPRNNFQRNDDNFDRGAPVNSCVKLQPFYGGYSEVRRFFQGLFITNVGIKSINDEYGQRTGMVYIQFGHPQGKIEALRKSGEVLNGMKVEITHLDDEEFETAVDRYVPDNYQGNDDQRSSNKFRSKNITKYFNKPEPELQVFSCLTVDDLPTYVKEQDILKLFSPRPLLSLFLTLKQRGGHIAYVKFGSVEEAKKAYEEKSGHIIEGKQVTVKPCEDHDFEEISKQHELDLEPTPVETVDTDCISITHLPPQITTIDITDFFTDIGVRPNKVHLMSNRMGFTGQAFCEFKSQEETAQALAKDNSNFGPNVVTVEPIDRQEMEQVLQQSQIPPPYPQPQLAPRLNPMNPIRPFFPRGNFDGMGRGGGPRFMGHRLPRPRFMSAGVTDDAPPGCTIFMDNVPYKAGTNEILDFFDGYDITNNVSRRFNPNNTPSAEAKVIFNSPEEAYRALQEKNGQKIWDRPIYLKQV